MGNKKYNCDFCGHKFANDDEIVQNANGMSVCRNCAQMILDIKGAEPFLKGFRSPVEAQTGNSEMSHNNRHGNRNHYRPNQNITGSQNPPKFISREDIKKQQMFNLPTPAELKAKLDEYIIGQDEAKKVLSVAVYNHYRRINETANKRVETEEDDLKDVNIEKSNVLMVGPTGCGKTLIAKTLAKILNVPFAIADATTLTEAGYVGEDVENVVRYLWLNADKDIERTKYGLVFLDEVDKIASKTQNTSITRDVSGEGVQQALLKIVEGTTCRFTPEGGRKHPESQLIEVDTSNILFICSGAFVGLDKIIEKRTSKHSNIGFGSAITTPAEEDMDSLENDKSVRMEDLVQFGFIPELIGRLPIVTRMSELTEEQLMRVLTEPKNSITKQYRKLLKMNGIDLRFTDGALRCLAKKAIARKTGARGLRGAMEKIMLDVMFEAPNNHEPNKVVEITEDIVNGKRKATCNTQLEAPKNLAA